MKKFDKIDILHKTIVVNKKKIISLAYTYFLTWIGVMKIF